MGHTENEYTSEDIKNHAQYGLKLSIKFHIEKYGIDSLAKVLNDLRSSYITNDPFSGQVESYWKWLWDLK